MLSILDPVLDRHPLQRGRTLMSALAALLIIVPLAALQPYRSAPQAKQSASAATQSSTAASQSKSADSLPLARDDRSLPQRLQSLDSARQATGAKLGATGAALGTMDTARARIASSASTSASSASSSSTGAEIETRSGPVGDDDSCERFQYGNSSQRSFHMHANEDGSGRATIRYLDFDQSHCRAAIISGKIVTPENEDRIIEIQPAGSGRATFRERTARFDREVTVANGGAIVYRVNGVERPYDDEGRRWFAELLPRVLAEASINVEQRVKHWRSQGGADAALQHIADLRSSGAKRAHYGVLLDASQLSAAELDHLVKQAGKDIPSSGDLRAVLSKAASQQNRGKVSGSTLEEAMGAIPSSGDLTSVLLAFGQTDDREISPLFLP